MVYLSDILFPAAILMVSATILLKLKVFSPHKLDNAPQRPNRLTAIELIATLFVALATPILLHSVIKRVDILSSLMDVMAALFIILGVSGRFADGRRGLGISGRGKLKAVGFGVLLYLGIMPWLIIVEALSALGQKWLLHEKNKLHPVLKQLEQTHSPEQILSLVVMICIIAPIAEELFFRGLLQTLIIRTIAVVRRRDTDAEHVRGGERLAGILIAAAIFAAVHLSVTADAWSWLPALFLLGIALGYAYERTGKLWADITIHSLFNAFAVVMIVGFHAGAPATAHAPTVKPQHHIMPASTLPQ
ncbi:MAG: CPBP family intramembrane glutamic endopeptidase [Phycisphaerae bacterium]